MPNQYIKMFPSTCTFVKKYTQHTQDPQSERLQRLKTTPRKIDNFLCTAHLQNHFVLEIKQGGLANHYLRSELCAFYQSLA